MPSHRAAEISYYEELGVEPDASPAEIRDSFRALVRLLHPDQQVDPELKAIAERQLRRVNGIYAVLSDPEKRRRYDAAFQEDYTAPAIVFNPASNIDPRKFVLRLLWIGAAVILTATCVWLYVDNPESSGSVPVEAAVPVDRVVSVPSAPPVEDSDRIEGLRLDLRIARSERDAARSELNRLKALLASAGSAIPEPPPPAAVAESVGRTEPDVRVAPFPPRTSAVSASAVPRPAAPKPLGSDAHQFAGFWFFAPGTERNTKGLYPPQFIEAILTERNGVIHGRYRSRYRIVDRAISPDVNFEFTGTSNGTTLTTPWTGLGGAKGQLVLSLVGENSLKFDWTATELGSGQGLTSGTATLTRRIE